MLLMESLKRSGAKGKDFAILARAERGRHEHPSAETFDVASQVGEGASEAHMVVDEKVGAMWPPQPPSSESQRPRAQVNSTELGQYDKWDARARSTHDVAP
jgi:hypothetical protein